VSEPGQLRQPAPVETSSNVVGEHRRDKEDVLDGSSFDKLTRLTVAGTERRGVLRSGLAVILAGLGISTLLDTEKALAKKKKGKKGKGGGKKKGKGKGGECLGEGNLCGSDNQCCPGKTLRVCEVPFGAGNSDKRCCPGAGHACTPPEGSGPYCCTGEAGKREFTCIGGVCQDTTGAP
jgi:hypothetical protein